MSNTITFINHASIKFSLAGCSILTDPWYSGDIFNKGWKLIHQNKKDQIIDCIRDVNYIFISHEHPDHFSINFFLDNEYKKILIENKTKILFQKTKDKRVINFLKKNNYEVIEIDEKNPLKINEDLEINIVKFGYIDSALIINNKDIKILNLNDCPLNNEEEIYKFKKKYGEFDILLSQFSYAAWKGGKENKNYRKDSANFKIESLKKQSLILNCKKLIPFASFIYFSNVLNKYMNDEINTPDKVFNATSESIETIIFKPGESQKIDNLKQNITSLDFWRDEYKKIKNLDYLAYSETVSIYELKESFNNYKKKLFSKNSFLIIKIISIFSYLNFFQKINIYLIDHKKNYEYSIFEGIKESNINNYDLILHSESLNFIFKNEFGFDTLTVNGCFEINKDSFPKIVKNFAIGTLNSMGMKLSYELLFNFKLVLFFFKLISKVKKKIA